MGDAPRWLNLTSATRERAARSASRERRGLDQSDDRQGPRCRGTARILVRADRIKRADLASLMLLRPRRMSACGTTKTLAAVQRHRQFCGGITYVPSASIA